MAVSTLYLAVCCFAVVYSQSEFPLPPSIIQGPSKDVYYFEADYVKTIEIECQATGNPKPRITWKKDDVKIDFGPGSNKKKNDLGSLLIETPTSTDEGYYQCFAWNNHGKAISRSARMRAVRQTSFSRPNDVQAKEGTEFEGLKIICRGAPTISIPSKTVNWEIFDIKDETTSQIDTTGGRIIIDQDGDLHFVYLRKLDETAANKQYKCSYLNSFLNQRVYGSPTTLGVNPSAAATPVVLSYSTSEQVYLRDSEVTLMCIFHGRVGSDIPTIGWMFKGPNDRSFNDIPANADVQGKGNTIIIKKIQFDNEGEYRCTAATTAVSGTIKVNVQSVPYWTPPGPRYGFVGEDVPFPCIAQGKPAPNKPKFMVNGENYDTTKGNFKLDDPETSLIVTNVSLTDSTVIQCNVSNVHGYVLGNSLLKVLKPSVFDGKNPVTLDLPRTGEDAYAEFTCNATHDDAVTLSYQWYYVDDKTKKETVLRPAEHPSVDVTSENMLIIDLKKAENDEADQVPSEFRCKAELTYQAAVIKTIQKNVTLKIEGKPGPKEPPPEPFPWWIIVVVILLLLLIAIIIVICCCLRRNKEVAYSGDQIQVAKFEMYWIAVIVGVVVFIAIIVIIICLIRRAADGGDYRVDEKERAAGHDPEKELADSGFHDYARPDAEPVGGSRASLTDSIKPLESDEDSMAEYGDIDTGKFNEDGSFIGLYGSDRKKKRPTEQNNIGQSTV